MSAELIGYLVRGPYELREPDINKMWEELSQEIEGKEGRFILGGDPESDEDLNYADMMDIISRLREFWPCPCASRDSAFRRDPDNPNLKWVFTGEMTWGDAPDGFGYTVISQAINYGIAEYFDIL